jgi:hypothetical protein
MMRVEVVADQMNFPGIGKVLVEQSSDLLCPVYAGAVLA